MIDNTTTNEVVTILNQPAVKGLLTELVAYAAPIVVGGLLVWLRRLSVQLKIKTEVADVMVRGVQKLPPGSTEFVKKSIQAEAIGAGVEKHVNDVVKDVKATMAEEKKIDSIVSGQK